MMNILKKKKICLMKNQLNQIRKSKKEKKRWLNYMNNFGVKMDKILNKVSLRIKPILKDQLKSLYGEQLIKDHPNLHLQINILKERNLIKLKFIIWVENLSKRFPKIQFLKDQLPKDLKLFFVLIQLTNILLNNQRNMMKSNLQISQCQDSNYQSMIRRSKLRKN